MTTVKGIDSVMNNLNAEIKNIKGRTVGGLLAGGMIIQAEAQRNTPVLTGNLKASAFTRKSVENDQAVEVGFGAAYAIFVHENLEAYHHVGHAKFLELAVETKMEEVVKAVADRAKVGAR